MPTKSTQIAERNVSSVRQSASLFAALGDETRLMLLSRLGHASPLSISDLAEGSGITRQAITKHLQVLQQVGVIKGVRQGREKRFHLEPNSLDDAKAFLEVISKQWGEALSRLKKFAESE